MKYLRYCTKFLVIFIMLLFNQLLWKFKSTLYLQISETKLRFRKNPNNRYKGRFKNHIDIMFDKQYLDIYPEICDDVFNIKAVYEIKDQKLLREIVVNIRLTISTFEEIMIRKIGYNQKSSMILGIIMENFAVKLKLPSFMINLRHNPLNSDPFLIKKFKNMRAFLRNNKKILLHLLIYIFVSGILTYFYQYFEKYY